MKIWINILTGVVFAAIAWYVHQDLLGIILAGVTLVAAIALPQLASSLIKKNQGTRAAYALIGILVALGGMGLAAPLFAKLPAGLHAMATGVMCAVSAYLFLLMASEKGAEVRSAPAPVSAEPEKKNWKKVPKVLDTSIVIDGRIIDVATTGFVEGPFIIPNFVLRELQLISDSPDSIKRNRGRRGLDLLNSLQKREDLEVEISYKDYTETREVDAKLIKLSKEVGAQLVTNDFNLNKVAELQGITVLNINNLANALKPVVLPGEEMEMQVVKEGKDENQGIGYLDDGTMVVIENGGKLVGKKVKVTVTSVIQTNAGKMIFTKVAGRN